MSFGQPVQPAPSTPGSSPFTPTQTQEPAGNQAAQPAQPPAPAPVTPAPFIPQYVGGPGVIQADGMFYPVAYIPYCLSPDSAKQLAQILSDLSPKIVLESPLDPKQFGGGITQTGMVPYLEFPNGVRVNAGMLANSWRAHANDQAYAEKQCRADLQARFDKVAS